MDKNKKTIIEKNDLFNKLLDYCLLQEIKDSEELIKMIKNHIKIYEIEKSSLMNKSFFGYLNKETKNKIKIIDDKIYDEYVKLEDELSIIIKLQDSLSNNI